MSNFLQKKRCIVIVDAVTPGYNFPQWVRYYERAVGRNNIHAFTYGNPDEFAPYDLGRVTDIGHIYNNYKRINLFNDILPKLLEFYDTVIRVDADEFLVPDPRHFRDLKEYIQKTNEPYVTALGIDMLEMPSDLPMNYDNQVILSQRSFCIKSAAYCKTCFVQMPLKWNVGFHNASVVPRFSGLFLFHMKFSDCRRRLAWLEGMCSRSGEDIVHKMHFRKAQRDFILIKERLHKMCVEHNPEAFWDTSYQSMIEKSVTEPLPPSIYFGNVDGVDDKVLKLPEEFRGYF